VQQNRLPPVAAAPARGAAGAASRCSEVGRYGGTCARGFVGPGDGENGNRIERRPTS
jgi:hypothetical protein